LSLFGTSDGRPEQPAPIPRARANRQAVKIDQFKARKRGVCKFDMLLLSDGRTVEDEGMRDEG
jgi:hypothetical protein